MTDQTDAVVAGATVTLVDHSTRSARTLTTNASGRYIFVGVPPGIYDITVTGKGFAQAKIPEQKVDVGGVATLNVVLRVGAATETVEVQAAGVELQTTNATVGSSLTFDLAQALPALSRDVSGLVLLQPATAPTGATAGAVRDQNTFLLDGGNNTSDMDGNQAVYPVSFAANPITQSGGGTPTGVMPTPIESIEEFKVGVIGQGADFNAAAGSQVSMATRRGTNTWHGAAWEHYYGTNFAANNWSLGHTPSTDKETGQKRYYTPLPSRHQNRFGASAGGPIAPEFWGGKTYMFALYQGLRYPNISTFTKTVPTALMRAGVIQVQNSSSSPITVAGATYAPGQWMAFNLNPAPVTVNGVTYQPANVCGSGGNQACDPRAIGLNPIVNQIWSKWLPLPNNPSGAGDQFNTQGYTAPISLPTRDNNWVFRLDHDFGPNWRFMSSYRYYHLRTPATVQVDVGGILGGQNGQFYAAQQRPQVPSYYVAGLTTTISSHVTNDLRYSFLRNYWEWKGPGAPAQPIPGLGGAVEIGGETSNALIPYNVNTQNVRTRFWDGQDHTFRDDLTWLHGNHLFQFGGSYQRNFNWHDRNDNGVSTMAANVYLVADNAGINWTGFLPPSAILPAAQQSSFRSLYTQVLGIVGQPQTLYTRAGADLHLLPLGTHAFDKSVIPYYNAYFSDTWHVKPSFTLTLGLSYTLEMPPYEEAGKQVMLVDEGGNPISQQDWFANRERAALQGQVYNPTVGFATVKNVGAGRKYPYNPFYGGFSPRVSAAWNPHFSSGMLGSIFGDGKTVLRGGYSRIYGRLNGVDLVLVPLLGTGLMQAVSCQGAVRPANAVGGNQCLGVGGANPQTAFRIGTDGLVAPLGAAPSQTLPQPFFPGVGGNLAAGDGSVLDPNFRPNSNDTFTFSIQREVTPKLFVEAGYIGKLIHNEFQLINMDAVPWMTTLGGQTFAKAYAALYTAVCGLNTQTCSAAAPATVTPQPFVEAAMGGPSSAFCAGKPSCTAALVANSGMLNSIRGNAVYDLWSAMANQTSWSLGRTLPSANPPGGCPATITASTVCRQVTSVDWTASNGYGNYHAVYSSVTLRDFKGVTARSNFTWGRALGTGAEIQARSTRTVLNPWDVSSMYGSQDFDIKFLYNLAVNYAPPFFKRQQGVVGHLLGGWSVSPIFTTQSGFPLRVTQSEGSCTTCQAFGQSAPGSTSTIYAAPLIGNFSGDNSLNYRFTAPSGTVGTTATSNNVSGQGAEWLNIFADPAGAYGQFRRLVLGIDERGNAFGNIRGFPRWNLDMTIAKEIRATERIGLTFTSQFTNVLNHFQPDDPTVSLNSPASFGRVSGQAYDSRQIEFGLRLRW